LTSSGNLRKSRGTNPFGRLIGTSDKGGPADRPSVRYVIRLAEHDAEHEDEENRPERPDEK